MNAVETMIDAFSNKLAVIECDLYKNTKRYGIYADGHILIERRMSNSYKKVVLLEEYLHYKHTAGDILNESTLSNKKQENFVRRKNYETLFSWECIVRAYYLGFKYYHDVAEYFDLPESFVREAVEHYRRTHEKMWDVGEYIIYLDNYIEVYKK
ncbi:toxin [Listeria booriae]|uniref:toxin n=1 Tax=Listeria booriae TaxID=1552123 RepID=UPI001625DC76|nr:toxin [Listeria booriae]MBC2196274.1 toxin [Listeria booriae]